MLATADAGLYSWGLFCAFAATGADLAWRIGASISGGTSAGHPMAPTWRWSLGLGCRPTGAPGWSRPPKPGASVSEQLARVVRVVAYTVPDRNPNGELIAIIIILTTIVDPKEASALELAGVCQEWEEDSGVAEDRAVQLVRQLL